MVPTESDMNLRLDAMKVLIWGHLFHCISIHKKLFNIIINKVTEVRYINIKTGWADAKTKFKCLSSMYTQSLNEKSMAS